MARGFVGGLRAERRVLQGSLNCSVVGDMSEEGGEKLENTRRESTNAVGPFSFSPEPTLEDM